MEQVSTPTAVECGSTDREPSGKFTEQPKLPKGASGQALAPSGVGSVPGKPGKQEWQTGKQLQHSAVTGQG